MFELVVIDRCCVSVDWRLAAGSELVAASEVLVVEVCSGSVDG